MTTDQHEDEGARDAPTNLSAVLDEMRALIDEAITAAPLDEEVSEELHDRWRADAECQAAEVERRAAYRALRAYAHRAAVALGDTTDVSDDDHAQERGAPREFKDYSDAQTRCLGAMEAVQFDVGFRRGIMFWAMLTLSILSRDTPPLKLKSRPRQFRARRIST